MEYGLIILLVLCLGLIVFLILGKKEMSEKYYRLVFEKKLMEDAMEEKYISFEETKLTKERLDFLFFYLFDNLHNYESNISSKNKNVDSDFFIRTLFENVRWFARFDMTNDETYFKLFHVIRTSINIILSDGEDAKEEFELMQKILRDILLKNNMNSFSFNLDSAFPEEIKNVYSFEDKESCGNEFQCMNKMSQKYKSDRLINFKL